MNIEDEFYFLEATINQIYNDPLIEREKNLNEEFVPKYSIFRMM